MSRQFFWGPWMFSPATVLCIAILIGCMAIQASGLWLPRLLLIYLGGIEGASLVGALVCSAIRINRISLSAPSSSVPEAMELSQGIASNPVAGDAYPMPAPEPAVSEESPDDDDEQGQLIVLDEYRRR